MVRCPTSWYVYILHCGDGSLYTGIATDTARRVEEHNGDDLLAAKYTRAHRPVVLVYQESCPDRAGALRRERAIKRLPRRKKLELINQGCRLPQVSS